MKRRFRWMMATVWMGASVAACGLSEQTWDEGAERESASWKVRARGRCEGVTGDGAADECAADATNAALDEATRPPTPAVSALGIAEQLAPAPRLSAAQVWGAPGASEAKHASAMSLRRPQILAKGSLLGTRVNYRQPNTGLAAPGGPDPHDDPIPIPHPVANSGDPIPIPAPATARDYVNDRAPAAETADQEHPDGEADPPVMLRYPAVRAVR